MFEALLIVCLLNGLLSPALPVVMAFAPIWMPEMVPLMNETVYYGASLIIAFGTMLIAGVPAALYERLTGAAADDRTAMAVWLAGALVLTLPALSRLF